MRQEPSMTYAYIRDVPADEGIYRQIRDRLPTETPKGMSCHIVVKLPAGNLRYIDVWKTEADWDRFRDEWVEPAVAAVLGGYGIPHDHDTTPFETFEVLESWVGSSIPPG
jgi:hypothetical protein